MNLNVRLTLVWLCVLLLGGGKLSAQNFTITGKVINKKTREALPFASVFLSQTTLGSQTLEKSGAFRIDNVPVGKYDLVVQYVGYQRFLASIEVKNEDLQLLLELEPSVSALKEVVVKRTIDPNRAAWMDVFKANFLGRSSAAKRCVITNEELIDFSYNERERTLTATSQDFLEIINPYLGYKLKFLLEGFIDDRRNGYTMYYGNPYFEPLKPKNARQQRRWEKNREEAYYGSSMHFFRSLHSNTLVEEGFLAEKIVRKERKPGFIGSPPVDDGGKMLNRRSNRLLSTKTVDYLYPGQVPYDSIYRAGAKGEMDTLIVKNILRVIYKNGTESREYLEYQGFDPRISMKQTSLFYLLEPEAVFDNNGNLANPTASLFEGYWGWQKQAEMLPLDYRPATPKK
ncbi:carboxypeptidase-like protein [Chitinophaga skermanii]|uniref:Carboxypeptidase-like protein n=1 Tax=Chitinophaga skermanii TaxID=331697 RepID=A0A327QG71_9BACT|nr:carboxypeptidase-like regulatory domain-containing protein [Chitinophaga skermanii]RAJ02642.1 carboxypeptidase-like protein [Chitinophaga skermanii]